MTVVRPAVPADLAALTDIYNDYVRSGAATFDTVVFSVDGRRTWLAHYADTGPHRLLVAEDSGELVGYATSSPFRSKPAYATSVETSVYCRAGETGRGLGTLLYAALFEVLSREDVHRAYAGVALPNDASVALHRRLGFQPVGTYHEVGRKFGRYWDVRWFERPVP